MDLLLPIHKEAKTMFSKEDRSIEGRCHTFVRLFQKSHTRSFGHTNASQKNGVYFYYTFLANFVGFQYRERLNPISIFLLNGLYNCP